MRFEKVVPSPPQTAVRSRTRTLAKSSIKHLLVVVLNSINGIRIIPGFPMSSNPCCPPFVEQSQIVDVGSFADDEIYLLGNRRFAQNVGFTAVQLGLDAT